MIHHHKIPLDIISNKSNGVFIVNIIGEEKVAKAIIKKGKLALVYSNCGRTCSIVNE